MGFLGELKKVRLAQTEGPATGIPENALMILLRMKSNQDYYLSDLAKFGMISDNSAMDCLYRHLLPAELVYIAKKNGLHHLYRKADWNPGDPQQSLFQYH